MPSAKKPRASSVSRKGSQQARAFARAYKTFKFPERVYAGPDVALSTLQEDAVATAALAATFDWRDSVAVPPAGNQQPCNACSSFAIASTIEICWLIARPGNAIRVSPGYIHTCLGHADDTDPRVICSYGVDLFAALTLVSQQGFATPDAVAYPCPPGVCGVTQPTGRISAFEPISGAAMAKAAIQNAGPIAADMYIWEDFFDYTTARAPTYRPDVTRQGPYPHSVCVIGFNDQGWIVKNSMGSSWGDGRGCAVISYGSCALLGAPPPPGGVSRQAFAVSL